ncbi:hypothetical protein Cadr_000008886 [Camelus dromedarius]|uniref:Uncharacterized protein n=1 Tax=Camelus dromedarius TaxID=9838 RepID=A0A5N4DKP4_CAMDR|nr:hypothetical protein Cadr_000008886 [Camelus dromedarius]
MEVAAGPHRVQNGVAPSEDVCLEALRLGEKGLTGKVNPDVPDRRGQDTDAAFC